MPNAERNTSQNQENQNKWDSLKEPFDTSKVENPTQDDLAYEAWLKSNANPAFEGNRFYQAENAEDTDTAEEAPAEAEENAENATKPHWTKMTDQEKEALLNKYPRLPDEKTNDWGKRIEASEGYNIFGDKLRRSIKPQVAENAAAPAAEEPEPAVAQGGAVEATPAEVQTPIVESAAAEEAPVTPKNKVETEAKAKPEAAAKPAEKKPAKKTEVAESGRRSRHDNIMEAAANFKRETEGKETPELIERIESELDKAFVYDDIARIWEETNSVIERSSDVVKAHMETYKIGENVTSLEEQIASIKDRLRKLPRFTLPGSPARYSKRFDQAALKRAEADLAAKRAQYEESASRLPEISTQEDLDNISGLIHIKQRAKYLHREANIRDNEDSIKRYAGIVKYMDEHPEVEREASDVQRQIYKGHRETLASLIKQREGYMDGHPDDFILHPNKDTVTHNTPFETYDLNVHIAAVTEIVQDDAPEITEEGGGEDGLDLTTLETELSEDEKRKKELEELGEEYKVEGEALTTKYSELMSKTDNLTEMSLLEKRYLQEVEDLTMRYVPQMMAKSGPEVASTNVDQWEQYFNKIIESADREKIANAVLAAGYVAKINRSSSTETLRDYSEEIIDRSAKKSVDKGLLAEMLSIFAGDNGRYVIELIDTVGDSEAMFTEEESDAEQAV